jgi:non-heme chloroperoxidase
MTALRLVRITLANAGLLLASHVASAQPTTSAGSGVPALQSSLVADVPGIARRVLDVPGARLQWLDFGGRGATVVLLPGLGNTAWIYSDFGRALVREGFRVVALTRRGHGESSAPEMGAHYMLDTLAADVIVLLDTLGVQRAHLVGHSFAGAELTHIAARHASRVNRLVYLDAAYDRQAQLTWISRQPSDGTRPMTAADRASPAAYLAYQRYARRGDLEAAWGEAVERDYLASLEQRADGSVRWRLPLGNFGAMLGAAGAAPPDYASVKAPSLAMYARQVRYALPSLASDAPAALRDSVQAFERNVLGPWVDSSMAQFRAGAGVRCAVELDAVHHVFLQREAEVVALVRRFLRDNTPCGS